MFVLTKDGTELINIALEERTELEDTALKCYDTDSCDREIGEYETEEEAKAAFEDLIEQIDKIEGVARVK